MTICHGEFAGQFILAGTVESDVVKVFIDDVQAAFSFEDHKRWQFMSLILVPFSRFVLFSQNPSRLRSGYCLELSGSHVGGFTQGRSSADGTGVRFRPVRKATTNVTYYRSCLKASIRGVAEMGAPVGDDLPPVSFEIHFSVPVSNFKSFFRLDDETQVRIEKLHSEECERESTQA